MEQKRENTLKKGPPKERLLWGPLFFVPDTFIKKMLTAYYWLIVIEQWWNNLEQENASFKENFLRFLVSIFCLLGHGIFLVHI